jgi:IS1 family transposase
MKLDELFSYIKKRQIKVWAAVDRNRLHFAGFEIGDASLDILRKFWNKMTKTNDLGLVCADGNLSYLAYKKFNLF